MPTLGTGKPGRAPVGCAAGYLPK